MSPSNHSVFLNELQKLFGNKLLKNPSLSEALTQNEDYNRPLAMIGDSVLDLVVNKVAYHEKKKTVYMDCIRKRYAVKKSNQKTLNQDIEFTKYLIDNEFTNSPVGGIGLDKADRFFEAIIGAVYVELGYDETEKFVFTLLKTNEDFHAIFPDAPIKGMFCPDCKRSYSFSEWTRQPVFEDFNGPDSEMWFDYWELTCPKGHKISKEHI